MTVYNIHDSKTHFSRLIEKVLNGEEVIIARDGKPVARLLPIETQAATRIPGNDKGKIRLAADFDAPLPEFDL